MLTKWFGYGECTPAIIFTHTRKIVVCSLDSPQDAFGFHIDDNLFSNADHATHGNAPRPDIDVQIKAMSYGMLHHDDQSKNDHVRVRRSSSPPIRRKSGSDHDNGDLNFTEREDLEGDFELKDLSHDSSGREHRDSTIDANCEDWGSEDEKSSSFCQSRRASASTVQSFMLYTPDEERSVIRKFDRRLVLFVAFLYMLSFLDRSSMHIAIP